MLGTPQGWALIAWGNLIGLGFAALTLALVAVAFPLLVDRPVGPVTAVLTSLAAVRQNIVPMAAWGIVVAALLLIGSLPFFVGLAIVCRCLVMRLGTSTARSWSSPSSGT